MYVRGITDIANAFSAPGLSSYDQLECSYFEDFRDSVTGCACLQYNGPRHTYWAVLDRPDGAACFESGGGVYNAWPARVGPGGDAISYAFYSPRLTLRAAALRQCRVQRGTWRRLAAFRRQPHHGFVTTLTLVIRSFKPKGLIGKGQWYGVAGRGF